MVEQKEEFKHMTKGEAETFFSEFYRGAHHIPGHKVHDFGLGWMVKHDRGDMATHDFNDLTRLVLMAHRDCYRASVDSNGSRGLKVCIWKRKREGPMDVRHPTIEQAMDLFNGK